MSPRQKTQIIHGKDRLDVTVSDDGISISLDVGVDIICYWSKSEPGRFVIEIDTSGGIEGLPGMIRTLAHDVPDIKIMLNEAIISNDGGADPVDDNPQLPPKEPT